MARQHTICVVTTHEMEEQHALPWGNITLVLDNEAFREGFVEARRWYFEDSYGEHGRAPEEPQRATRLTSEELLHLVILPDERGVYHFDEMGEEALPEYLGYLFGYVSGPLLPEMPEEQQRRTGPHLQRWPVLTLPEA